jgi:RraA family protein
MTEETHGWGFRVLKRPHKVDEATVALFRQLPVAIVSDSMSRMAAGGSRIRPMHAGGGFAGPALTVKTRPGDNLMVHKAIDLAEPGDVLVVDAGGDLTNAIIGEMMAAHAVNRGIAGIVINGAVRDSKAIGEASFPVYAAGVTHRGPYRNGPGEINVEVSIDGMVICPGDLVIGDDDGILAVPHRHARAIYEVAAAKKAEEDAVMAKILKGANDRSWVDAELARTPCRFA